MTATWRTLLAAALLTLSIAAQAQQAAPPSKVQARYVVIKSGIEIAEMDEVYTLNHDRYTLTSTARPLGLLALFRPGKVFIHSEGNVTSQGLQPQSFGYRQEDNSQKNSEAKFLWPAHQLALTYSGQHAKLYLPRGTQDRLSAMYQFMFLELKARQTLDFPMTNGSKLDVYHYAVAAGPTINTAAGRFDTLYLDSQQAKAGETRTQVWLATGRHNLPCKMVITDPEGGKLTQELRKLDIQP